MDERGIVGGGIQTIAPISLVEDTVHKNGLVVEGEDFLSIDGRCAEFPHTEVALYGIATRQIDGDIVQERVIGGPRTEILVLNSQNCYTVLVRVLLCNHHAVLAYQHSRVCRVVGANCNPHFLFVKQGGNPQGFDIVLHHRLHPHRLPDTALGGIPDAATLETLFSVSMVTGTGAVGDNDNQCILAIAQTVGDIAGKRQITALVCAH